MLFPSSIYFLQDDVLKTKYSKFSFYCRTKPIGRMDRTKNFRRRRCGNDHKAVNERDKTHRSNYLKSKRNDSVRRSHESHKKFDNNRRRTTNDSRATSELSNLNDNCSTRTASTIELNRQYNPILPCDELIKGLQHLRQEMEDLQKRLSKNKNARQQRNQNKNDKNNSSDVSSTCSESDNFVRSNGRKRDKLMREYSHSSSEMSTCDMDAFKDENRSRKRKHRYRNKGSYSSRKRRHTSKRKRKERCRYCIRCEEPSDCEMYANVRENETTVKKVSDHDNSPTPLINNLESSAGPEDVYEIVSDHSNQGNHDDNDDNFNDVASIQSECLLIPIETEHAAKSTNIQGNFCYIF